MERESVSLEGDTMATGHFNIQDVHISVSEFITTQFTLPVAMWMMEGQVG